MKKITKVILAAALVLLVLGAFTGAAAALDVTKLSPQTVETGTSAPAGVVAGAIAGTIAAPVTGAIDVPLQARQLPSDSAPIAVVVKVMEKKGDSSVTPLTPSLPPIIHVKPEIVTQTTVKHTYVPGALAVQDAQATLAAQAALEIAR